MATISALDTLIELASIASDTAAQRLGRALGAVTEAEQKLALLARYRDEYAVRFQSSQATGMTVAGYRNYQQFIDKIDQAIQEQKRSVAQSQERAASERNAWQSSERKRASYGALANRAVQAALHQEGKRDQKQSDEHAARQFQYKR